MANYHLYILLRRGRPHRHCGFCQLHHFSRRQQREERQTRLERTGKYYNTLEIFMVSSLAALSFSVGSLMTFLGLLTSRHQAKDFSTNLPLQLLFGLSILFFSVIAMLSSFCSGYFFVLEGEIKKVALAVYVVPFSPVCLFAALEFPLYLDLIRATLWSPFSNTFMK